MVSCIPQQEPRGWTDKVMGSLSSDCDRGTLGPAAVSVERSKGRACDLALPRRTTKPPKTALREMKRVTDR
ncbi:hypothetical protein IFM12275_18760 [Nocardia sputorum]|uniref:Uncharacterized protein n=1 Tax=Nocardia sputorum TaxID=2984338 RepID=A0ABM8CZD8_9NOCA|nr:hypothetical protein IFM12275_18760 [Nocardia sputorum]BDU00426.1 hypothetical protein IFM12276_34540 [Nocardia sputorum]